MTEAQRRRYWQELREDLAEFEASHKIESNGRKTRFIDAGLITLPGLVLRELEKKRMIECDGGSGFRPARK